MDHVHIVNGKYSNGKDSYRPIRCISFPLVDATMQKNDKGTFIVVNGVPVRGYPKRDFKVFVDDETCFRICDSEMADRLMLARDTDASFLHTPVADTELAKDSPVIELHGPDDAAIKERVKRRFFMLKQLAWNIAEGEINALIVSGPTGVGKSHEILQALETTNDSTDVMARLVDPSLGDPDEPAVKIPQKKPKIRWGKVGGSVTDAALYELLYEYRHENDVLFLDDANVFTGEKGLDFLKHATSDDPVRKIHSRRSSHSVRVNDTVPDSFEFRGRIIFATNKDFENLQLFPAAIRDHVTALVSRVYYLDMTMHTMREKFLRIEQVCIDEGLLKEMGLDEQAINEVFEFFKEHLNKFREVSIRTVQKLAKMHTLYGGNWKHMAATTTMRTAELAKLNLE